MRFKTQAEYKEYLELRNEIEYHNYLYYVKDNPIIPDAVFDKLLKKLVRIENENMDVVPADSPTQRVGAFKEAYSLDPNVTLNPEEYTAKIKELRMECLK
jgi:NAD-dependent DNA ligase